MIAEFIEAGHEVFDLGGGVGGSEDSLFRFRAGFSDCCVDYYTYRMIFNELKYEWLSDAKRERTAHANDANGYPLFFPAYRRPKRAGSCEELDLKGAASS